MYRQYVVVYLSLGGVHERFRCSANNKKEARKECHDCLGVTYKRIVEVYEEGEW